MELTIQLDTWNHENSGMFDFESKDLFSKKFRVNFDPSLPFNLVISRSDFDVTCTQKTQAAVIPSSRLSRSVSAQAVERISSAYSTARSSSYDDLIGEFKRDEPNRSGRMLLEFFAADGGVEVRAPTNTRLWRVAGKKLQVLPNDLVKFGRLKMRVKDVSLNKKTSEKDDYETDFVPNDNLQEDAEFDPLIDSEDSDNESREITSNHNGDRICRICYDSSEPGNPLISPCACKGSMSSIHVNCLERWIAGRVLQKDVNGHMSFFVREMRCELCKEVLPLKVEHPKGSGACYDISGFPKPDYPHIILETFNKNTSTRGQHLLGVQGKQKTLKLGRALDADLRLTDISVSRLHAQFELKDNQGFFLKDGKSRFGSLISRGSDEFIKSDGEAVSFQSGRTLITIKLLKRRHVPEFISKLFACIRKNGEDSRAKHSQPQAPVRQHPQSRSSRSSSKSQEPVNVPILVSATQPSIIRIISRVATVPSPDCSVSRSRIMLDDNDTPFDH